MKKKRRNPMAYIMLTSGKFRSTTTASKKDKMQRRYKKINKNNYKNYIIINLIRLIII